MVEAGPAGPAAVVLNLKRQEARADARRGCGIGRNLQHLEAGSVGVDHNTTAVRTARSQGLDARTVAELEEAAAGLRGTFDSLLVAHVLEHMSETEAEALLRSYLPYLKPGGKVFVVCPQERGFASDPTHVWFADARALSRLLATVGLRDVSDFSFPLPRRFGTWFTYNEFCVRATA
jgi:2-polyprenyl-3-methyl-5-hydroxy-6-metoxy-1,4-benzoquinol methylase